MIEGCQTRSIRGSGFSIIVNRDVDTFETDDSTEIPPTTDSHVPESVVVSSGLFNIVGNVSLGLDICRFGKVSEDSSSVGLDGTVSVAAQPETRWYFHPV